MRRKFWAAVALQILVLLGLAGVHGFTLATGRPVMLHSMVTSPWDPLRGEYISLEYDIGRLEMDRITVQGGPFESGQRVWVTLRMGDPYWTPVALSRERPAVAGNEVALRGRVLWTEPSQGGPKPERIFLRYGIEQFYVPEGQGKDLTGQMVELAVQAVVDPTGRAAVRTVYLKGEPIEWR